MTSFLKMGGRIGLVGLMALSASCSAPARQAGRSLSAEPADDDSFTLVALPDTQYYSERLPEAFLSQTRWIARHAHELNIQAVIGLGDIVDNGGELPQWHHAMSALNLLREARVPYFLAIGNHDYNPAYIGAAAAYRGVSHFNQFVGPDFYRPELGYGGSMTPGSNENFFGTLKIGGRDYLFVILEFSPRDEALAWASRVVEAHPDHEVIVAMHSYLFSDNTRITRCAKYNKRPYGLTQDNDGEEVWQKFARKYPNVRLVLSGHIPEDGVGRRYDLGAQGNLVNELLSDYQFEPHAGNGWLRIMKISPARNRIEVSTYSPYLDEHPELRTEPRKSDARNQFVVDYAVPASAFFAGGAIRGVVRASQANGAYSACAGIPGATVRWVLAPAQPLAVAAPPAEAAASTQTPSMPSPVVKTDALGRFSLWVPGPEPRAYQAVELTVSKPGWVSSTVHASVRDGDTAFEQVLLTPAPAAHPR